MGCPRRCQVDEIRDDMNVQQTVEQADKQTTEQTLDHLSQEPTSPATSLLDLHEYDHEHASFESLLINSLKQIPIAKTSKRKVISGAQVITFEEAIYIF